MSGLLELVIPSNRSEYSSIDDLTFALHDWAVKEKFSFRRAKSSGASWVCATKEETGCQWKVRGEAQKRWRIEGEGEEEGEEEDDNEEARLYTLVIVHGDHQCVGAMAKSHRSSAAHEWLDGAVARHMRVMRDTKPSAIVDVLKVQFLETISDKAAQLCKQRLLKSNLAAQRESFKLIPAYERRLREVSPGVYTDLQVDQNTGKTFFNFRLYSTYESNSIPQVDSAVSSSPPLSLKNASICLDAFLLSMGRFSRAGSYKHSCSPLASTPMAITQFWRGLWWSQRTGNRGNGSFGT
jgi:hypothetical protein